MASYNCVPIQDTTFLGYLEYVRPVIHFNTVCTGINFYMQATREEQNINISGLL